MICTLDEIHFSKTNRNAFVLHRYQRLWRHRSQHLSDMPHLFRDGNDILWRLSNSKNERVSSTLVLSNSLKVKGSLILLLS